jgi:hypothetical protein
MGCIPVLAFLILRRYDTVLESVFFVAFISIPFVAGRVLLDAIGGASLVVAVSGYGGLLLSQWGVAIFGSRWLEPHHEGGLYATLFLVSAPAIVGVYWLLVHWVSKWGRGPAIRTGSS